MSQATLAAGPDRLPWLDDEERVAPPRKARARDRFAGGAAAVAAIAALSFWLGAHSWHSAPRASEIGKHSTTVALPPAAPVPPQPEVRIIERQPQIIQVVQPAIHQTPQRELKIARPDVPPSTAVAETQPPAAPPATAPAPPPATTSAPAVRPVARSGPLTVWPARVSSGAYGRLVQIGAFGTRLQAKRGWTAMVRAYPAVSHLQAVVVGARNSRGRGFYRFQIGTTSQAHSEVLCQRMERIHFSCAVVGLPWKPKGVER